MGNQDEIELLKAKARIGLRTVQAMEWLVTFSNVDLPSLSSGQLTDLCYELKAFLNYSPLLYDKKRLGQTALPLMPTAQISADQARDFQNFTRMWFDNVIQKRHVALPLRNDTTRHVFVVGDQAFGMSSCESPPDIFSDHVYRLLCLHAHRLRRCAGCQQRILANRRNQQFCSTRCQSRLNMRRYRNTPPERLGKRGRPPKTLQTDTKASRIKKSQKRRRTDGEKKR